MKFNFNSKQKLVKSLNNTDLAHSLKESVCRNNDAIDYILEKKRIISDTYKYTESEYDKEQLEILEYIEIVLKFVGEQYSYSIERLV